MLNNASYVYKDFSTAIDTMECSELKLSEYINMRRWRVRDTVATEKAFENTKLG